MTPMTLGELRDALARCEPTAGVRTAPLGLWWDGLDSWRGIYAEPAIHYALSPYDRQGPRRCSVKDALEDIDEALRGREFFGYKGGEYRFDRSSPVHVDNSGESTPGNCLVGVRGQRHVAWLIIEWNEGACD